MPDIASRLVEGCFHPRDLVRQCRDHVLRSVFDILRTRIDSCAYRNVFQSEPKAILTIVLQDRLIDYVCGELFPVEHFKVDEVKMNRVSIARRVVDFPDFGRAKIRVLRRWFVPGDRTADNITGSIYNRLCRAKLWLQSAKLIHALKQCYFAYVRYGI